MGLRLGWAGLRSAIAGPFLTAGSESSQRWANQSHQHAASDPHPWAVRWHPLPTSNASGMGNRNRHR